MKHCEWLLLCWLTLKTGQFVTFKRLIHHTAAYTEKTARQLANPYVSSISPSLLYVRWICNYRAVVLRQRKMVALARTELPLSMSGCS